MKFLIPLVCVLQFSMYAQGQDGVHAYQSRQSVVDISLDFLSQGPFFQGEPISFFVKVIGDASHVPTGWVAVQAVQKDHMAAHPDENNLAASVQLGDTGEGFGEFINSTDSPRPFAVVLEYSGDGYYKRHKKALRFTQPIFWPCRVELSVSDDPAVWGHPLEFTAHVATDDVWQGYPTGEIAFKDGDTTLCRVELEQGEATCSDVMLDLGFHLIRAEYTGDSYNSPSQAAYPLTVSRVATTTRFLTSPRDPVHAGKSGILMVHVQGQQPTGQVDFKEGRRIVRTADLDAYGQAQYDTSHFSEGTHRITAAYLGDAFNAPSHSEVPFVQVILGDRKGHPALKGCSSATPDTAWAGMLAMPGMLGVGLRRCRYRCRRRIKVMT